MALRPVLLSASYEPPLITHTQTHRLKPQSQEPYGVMSFCPSWASSSWRAVALWWTPGWQGQRAQYWLFTPVLLCDLIRAKITILKLRKTAGNQTTWPAGGGGVTQVCKHHLEWLTEWKHGGHFDSGEKRGLVRKERTDWLQINKHLFSCVLCLLG